MITQWPTRKVSIRRYWKLLPLLLLTLPSAAHAHLVSTRFGEFYSGFLHPLTTLVHLVPWLAVAMFAVLQGRPLARAALWLFPLAVAVGALAGISVGNHWQQSQPILLLNIGSIVAMGALVVWSGRVNHRVSLVLLVVFALGHGFANGDVDLADGSVVLYLAGVTAAAYVVITLAAGAAALVSEQKHWGSVALRALGSWILAAGLVYGGVVTLGIANV